MTGLAELQTRVLDAISGPLIPASAALLVRPARGLDAAEQIGIYRRAFTARLLRAFREIFPALSAVLGQDLFDAFVLDHLAQHPTSHFRLSDEARTFPVHLARTRPTGDTDRWAMFLVELAEVEQAWLDVSEGPGTEGAPIPTAADIFGQPTGKWMSSMPVPSPSLRLFAHCFPTATCALDARSGKAVPEATAARDALVPSPGLNIWGSGSPAASFAPSPGLNIWGSGSPAASFAPNPTCFALLRARWRVHVHALSAPQHALLAALDGSRTVREAIEHTGTLAAPGELRDWLAQWAAWGCFSSLAGLGSSAL